jgi:hypothetical protein
MRTKDNEMRETRSARTYSQTEAERFVKFLGCWQFANPTDAAKRRDDGEYGRLLRRLIEVNKSRQDEAGIWETAAAYRELDILRGGRYDG